MRQTEGLASIQNPIKHLQSFVNKRYAARNGLTVSFEKASFQMFGWPLNTSLMLLEQEMRLIVNNKKTIEADLKHVFGK